MKQFLGFKMIKIYNFIYYFNYESLLDFIRQFKTNIFLIQNSMLIGN